MTRVPVLRCRLGVTLDPIGPGGLRIIAALDRAVRILGHDLWITAGTNDHATGRHPRGEALDVSVSGLGGQQIRQLHRFVQQELGGRFTVLYETRVRPTDAALREIAFVNRKATGPHLHVQVKKGTEFPPPDPVAHA